MGKGPLDDPRLRYIEERLNAARLDEAQKLLAQLPERESLKPGASYLTTRLLYERGRLDTEALKERLRDVIEEVDDFPEAQTLLNAAEDDLIAPRSKSFGAHSNPDPRTVTGRPSAQAHEVTLVDVREPESWKGEIGFEIPRAPALPRVEVEPVSSKPFARVAGENPGIALAFGFPKTVTARDTLQEFISREGSGSNPNLSGESPQSSAPRSSPSAWRSRTTGPDSGPISGPGSSRTNNALNWSSAGAEVESAPPPDLTTLPSPPDFTRSAGTRGTLTGVSGEAEGRMRSMRPGAPEDEPTPSALTIASLLDDGQAGRALALLERLSNTLTPELVILRARALAHLKKRAAALADLDRLAQAPLLEPELRASGARLFLEIAEVERALKQARRAHDDDPESVMVRLTLALCLVRAARRSEEGGFSKQADAILAQLKPRNTPMPALVHGLKACIAAEIGDSERAVSTAQLALGLDPNAVDALAALAVASAKLRRLTDAERAAQRLAEISPSEAEAIAPLLERLGVTRDPDAEKITARTRLRAAQIWDPLEIDLVSGQREAAIGLFERVCTDFAREQGQRGNLQDFGSLAFAAASFFTEAPVFRNFAPYDLSLASTSRLEAAFSVLYGPGPRLNPITGRHPLLLLVGSYLGECVRQAFDGRWRGTPNAPQQAAVEVKEHDYFPFGRIEQRLKLGRSIRLDTEVTAHPAAEPTAQRSPIDASPPSPWDPELWPSPELFRRIGQALSVSVIALWAREFAGGPLDGSVASVSALDQYVSLLSPPTAAPEGDAGWVRRAAVLVGAYLTQVYEISLGAIMSTNETALGPLRYEVVLADGSVTHPVLQAYDRLSARRMSPLFDYVTRMGRNSLRP